MCMIMGNQQSSSDLLQGSLELPCTYAFSDLEDTTKKVKPRLIEEGNSVDDADEVNRKVGIQYCSQKDVALQAEDITFDFGRQDSTRKG